MPILSNAPSTANPEASLYLAKTLGSETTEYCDGESNEATLKKRQFVYKELLATEEDYISDLNTVIDVSVVCLSVYLAVCLFSRSSVEAGKQVSNVPLWDFPCDIFPKFSQ